MNLQAAHHEAGHAAVAEFLTGVPARIELWRESRDGATWVRGRCYHSTPNTAEHARLIALAGAVAETLAGPAGSNSGQALLQPTLRAVSPSDAIGAGAFDVADLDRCLAMVRTLWPQIQARARLEVNLFQRREVAGVAARAFI